MILHVISIGAISPDGLIFTLSSVIGSLVYLHVITTWLWVYQLKIVDFFSHQSNPQTVKHYLWINGRLSSSIQRSLLLMCFSILCHLTREKGETLSVAILTRLLTNSRNSIAINENWDFQVRMTCKLFNAFDLKIGSIVDVSYFTPPSIE